MFAKKVEANDDPEGFARDALSGLGFVLIALVGIGIVVMPWFVYALASGFHGDERFTLAVEHGRIAFPYILFISLTALLSGVLNSLGRFALAAAAPILMNVVMIAFLLWGWWSGGNIGLWQIWSVPVAGVAQLALVWWGCAKIGMPIRPRWPRLTPEMKRLTVIMVPALLAGGVVQINLIVGRQVGSFFDGAVAWLSYADRLYQLPLGVVGIAIGTVMLPDLSRRLKAGDGSGGRDAINRATELTLALTLPAAVALMVIPVPIVAVLFQHGAFDASDTWPTALAVAVYGAGLPAFVMQKVISPLYYAREDTRSPFVYAVHAVIAIGLAPFIGFIAAALGTTVAGWTMLLQLWWGTRAMGDAASADDRLRRAVPRVLLACIVMGCVLAVAAHFLAGAIAHPTLQYATLAVLVVVGAGVYAAAALGFGALKVSDVRAALRRPAASR
jgi:putative peptidoglycan lipid II flippase